MVFLQPVWIMAIFLILFSGIFAYIQSLPFIHIKKRGLSTPLIVYGLYLLVDLVCLLGIAVGIVLDLKLIASKPLNLLSTSELHLAAHIQTTLNILGGFLSRDKALLHFLFTPTSLGAIGGHSVVQMESSASSLQLGVNFRNLLAVFLTFVNDLFKLLLHGNSPLLFIDSGCSAYLDWIITYWDRFVKGLDGFLF
nr:MAG TPA: hypothetical protein [Caudoviricetes sp.]